MFEQFTDRAGKVMALANQEAQRLNHEYVGTEHILLGLVKEGTGIGANALRNLNVDLRRVRVEVEKLVKRGPDMVTLGKLPMTPRAQKVVKYAILEARSIHHNYVGTEHLLLGLLREEDGVAAQVLRNAGVRLDALLMEVRLLGPEAQARQMLSGEATSSEGTGMFKRFTDRARKAMALAKQEAERLCHEYIGTEHILLGLVKEGSGVAANVLKSFDVELRKVRVEVEKLVKSGPDKLTMGKLPQTPRAEKVLEYAIEEARKLDHNYVGTEHLLLGLLREQDGVAAQVLMNFGLKLEAVRDAVVSLFGAATEGTDVNAGRFTKMPVHEQISSLVRAVENRIEELLAAKEDAVRTTAYERAAELRDQAEAVREQLGQVNKTLMDVMRRLEGILEESQGRDSSGSDQ
jgi:ATP-dependent Clp protease ATP-binding subunit ClpA